MIFDHRTYRVKPGMIKTHLELYEKHGFATQQKHLGKPVLYATTEVGDVNAYIHVWAYKDLADRTARRAAMWADPDWLAYVKKSGELGALISQENMILVGTSFFKLPGTV
ncbi:MAG TPA: NIPSNAP family protein [Hyphomicrobiaceae bacterium]|nr:NIPSNAP family protein [Hyphomicrobiaceae bacterium]